jgi:TonB family protein
VSESLQMRRRRQHRRTRLELGAAFAAGALAPAAAGDAPRLTLRAPDGARSALASGGLAFTLHAGVVLALLIFTWLNPDLIEDVIPVQLLPGSVVEPAPAPRPLEPQFVNAALAPAVVAPSTPQTLAPQAAPDVQMARIDSALAPTRIERRDVATPQVAAVQSTAVPQIAPLDVARVGPAQVRPSTIALPDAPVGGPRTIQSGASQSAEVVAGASQAFARAGQARDHAGRATAGGVVASGSAGGGELRIDTGVAAAYVGGEGAGGSGTAVGVTDCLSSGYVVAYIGVVKERTYDRWVLPEGVPSNRTVKLRFTLDAAGTARDLQIVAAENPALGRSALDALEAASPFPPMDDNVRCLAGRSLIGTFTVPL